MGTGVDVLIVGGGLAGLACARALQEKGVSFEILEASDGLGGRVRTDEVDGFLLDRGFQVLLTAYPEAQRVLNYPKLDLRSCASRTISWQAGRLAAAQPFTAYGDHWDNPSIQGALVSGRRTGETVLEDLSR